jgi:hypothetical protein
MSRSRPRPLLIAVLVLLALGTAVAAAGAGPLRFTDVPPSHPFEREISAVASGNIAAGYPDGTFRPGDPITRQAMAAFLARGLGRAEFATGTVSGAGVLNRTVASLTVHHSASGYVIVNASTGGRIATEASCPCVIETRLVSGTRQSPKVQDELVNIAEPGGNVMGATSNTWVASVHGKGSTTFSLLARRVNAVTGNPTTTFEGSLTAQFVPFDGTGVFSG